MTRRRRLLRRGALLVLTALLVALPLTAGAVWTNALGAGDRFADPHFVSFDAGVKKPIDPRLAPESPAAGAGVVLPSEWPDPLRSAAGSRPDMGALPRGAAPWSVGVRGRIPLAGDANANR